MNTIRCEGLDGSNPLHFLAALGLLRLVSFDDAEVLMAWEPELPFLPVLSSRLDEAACHAAVSRHLGLDAWVRGEPGSGKTRSESDGVQTHQGRRKSAKSRRETPPDLDAQKLAARHPFAAAAECIHRVPQSEFQTLARQSDDPLWRALLPGLAADRVREYKKGESGLSRTRFSFSNKNSGKVLLKDFLANLALVRPAGPGSGLLGFSQAEEQVTGFMWEPTEQRAYALRWCDPADLKKSPTRSVPIHNVLALVGLSFFPVVPALPADRTAGFDERERLFTWPVWGAPLRVDTIASLLASPLVSSDSERDAAARGIAARFRVEVLSISKRNFFSPSRRV